MSKNDLSIRILLLLCGRVSSQLRSSWCGLAAARWRWLLLLVRRLWSVVIARPQRYFNHMAVYLYHCGKTSEENLPAPFVVARLLKQQQREEEHETRAEQEI